MIPIRPFQRIYFVVSQIPKGMVSTYKEVAEASLIENPRVVGYALHANKQPQKIPCHRVVKTTGDLATGYVFGGMKKQKEKLLEEGIVFIDTYKVDLTRCLAKLVAYRLPAKGGAIG